MINPNPRLARRLQLPLSTQVNPVKVELGSDGKPVVSSWEVYRILAGQTESHPAAWSPESTDNLRFVHHMLGVITEVEELVPSGEGLGIVSGNALEELGDLLWYTALMQTVLIKNHSGGMLPASPEASIENILGAVTGSRELVPSIRNSVALLADEIKRWLAYGNGSFDQNKGHGLYMRVIHIVAMCFKLTEVQAFAIDLPLIMQLNINKLSKRYPEGFNPTDAVNRQLKAEAEVMATTAAAMGSSFSAASVAAEGSNIDTSSADADIERMLDRQASRTAPDKLGRGCRNC